MPFRLVEGEHEMCSRDGLTWMETAEVDPGC